MAEIEPFARAVLTHHYPGTPLHGDFTRAKIDGAIELLVGGTPCQSFSIAGRRAGLDDARGNLAIEYLGLAHKLRAEWLVWENVPGLLSANGGRDFGAFLGLLGECGYGWAYRVLDTEYVRVDGFPRAIPQRRNRLFVVGHLGGWQRAAAVLFEPEGMRGDPPPRRAPREDAARPVENSARGGGRRPTGLDHTTIVEDNVSMALRTRPSRMTDRGGGLAWAAHEGKTCVEGNVSMALRSSDGGVSGFDRGGGLAWSPGQVADPIPNFRGLRKEKSEKTRFKAVRRLTPRECERLQGFPDDYTLVPFRGALAKDTPRYKALGNSMSVNVMRWIGRRIEIVNSI